MFSVLFNDSDESLVMLRYSLKLVSLVAAVSIGALASEGSHVRALSGWKFSSPEFEFEISRLAIKSPHPAKVGPLSYALGTIHNVCV